MTIKALSLWQPWASLIAAELKHYETRHWETAYRGPLVIHAAKKWTPELRAQAVRFQMQFPAARAISDWPLGVALCVVDLVDIIPTSVMHPTSPERTFGDFSRGRFAWHLVNVRLFTPPVPARGEQGLFDWRGPLP